MRVFVCALAASLSVAAPAQSAPVRAASLNLCTDELLLLLAAPGQVASVTHLARDPDESALWRKARLHPANDGSVMSVVRHRPELILTMGGGPRDRARIVGALGMRVVDVPYAEDFAGLKANLRLVGDALRRRRAAELWVARIEALQRSAPARTRDTLWLGGDGRSMGAGSLGAQWLRLAGLRQRSVRDDRVSLETLITAPPQVIVRSTYRVRQFSRAQSWARHPVAVRVRAGRELTADGRRWTCLGPLVIPDIVRLRRELAR